MKLRPLALAALMSSLTLSACAPEDEELQKASGGEEEALTDSKADSFFRPTQHGDIAFGVPSNGTLGTDTRFHAWNFDLTDKAGVSLETSSSNRNLDTVMYLYRWNDQTETWGRYIAKNDDASRDTLFSRIAKELETGKYRVIVKGLKRATSGPFSVKIECEGAGCAANAPEPPSIEVSNDGRFTDGCAERLYTVLDSGVMGTREEYVTLDQAAALMPEMYQAALWYGSEHLDDYAPEELEALELEVSAVLLEDGILVEVTDGGDYSMEYLFTPGRLLMERFNDQSPWVSYFCAEADEIEVAEPDEWCAGELLDTLPHNDDDAGEGPSGVQANAEDTEDYPAAVMHAVSLYRSDAAIDAEKSVEWSTVTWTGGWTQGWEITLQAEGLDATTYVVRDDDSEQKALIRIDAQGYTAVCK
ncbi:MAG: hypothetical protein ACE366_02090 [Bradymonadia bacterium]